MFFFRTDAFAHARGYSKLGRKEDKWLPTYADAGESTLLIVNSGVHFHEVKKFTIEMDSFITQLINVSKSLLSKGRTDHVVFRTSVPGHASCQKYKRPLEDPSQFHLSRKFEWHLVPEYNKYAKKSLTAERVTSRLKVSMLDVYPMTILRPDGHRARPGRVPDCLHYYLPGVVDWWNHLLISELQLMAETSPR